MDKTAQLFWLGMFVVFACSLPRLFMTFVAPVIEFIVWVIEEPGERGFPFWVFVFCFFAFK